MKDAVMRMAIGTSERVTEPALVDDKRFLARAQWTQRSGNFVYDETYIIRQAGSRMVNITLFLAKTSVPHPITAAAVLKVFEDVAMSVSPHGTTPPPVTFDAKSLLIRVKGDGIRFGDRPSLHGMDALNHNKAFDLKDYRGKIVVIDFWATWCPPCMLVLPHMAEINKAYSPRGVQILGINMDVDRSAMLAVCKQYNLTWPQNFEGKAQNSPLSKSWGTVGIPWVCVINPEGEVIFAGHASYLRGVIDAALQEFPPKSEKAGDPPRKPAKT